MLRDRWWFARSALRHARLGNWRWVKRRLRQAAGGPSDG